MMDQGGLSQCPELENPDCENDQFPFNPETVPDLPSQLDPYKSILTDGNHPRILKELAGVIAKPLLMVFEQSWESGEVPADWKLVNVVSVFKKSKKEEPRNYRPVSLTLVPDKVMEMILGGIEKYLRDNTVVLSCGHSVKSDRGQEVFGQCFWAYDVILENGVVQGWDLDSILVGPFQLSLFHDFVKVKYDRNSCTLPFATQQEDI